MRRWALILSIALIAALAWGQKQPQKSPAATGSWGQPQNSGTDLQLRGISAVSEKVAWASGAKGTVLRTVDGGATWEKVNVPGAETLDFRDVQAFDQNTAFVLSIGPGEQSRIYKTTDGGKNWRLQFTNHDPKAFYDCFAFWDRTHGIALSDSVEGKFPLLATADGATWQPVAVKKMPPALPNEGAFAASGTCVATFGKRAVWFGTGGPAARVFRSFDRGKSWAVAETPIIHGEATQGIFSLVFWSGKDGVAVGGDYKQPARNEKIAAFSHDGGKTWKLPSHMPSGYRSAVAAAPVPGRISLVAVGASGLDDAEAGAGAARDWRLRDRRDYNAVSYATPGAGWAVGPKGLIVRLPGRFGGEE
jgi:photosystem II stability/assembly factor-like uncharacterized protein